MPYETEHSCRLEEPEKFKPDTYGRKTREHNGKPYDVLYAERKDTGKTDEQAYRYKTKIWSASEARSHCKDHGGSFEAAKKDNKGTAQGALPLLLDYVATNLWAMEPRVLEQMANIIARHVAGERLSPEQLAEYTAERSRNDSSDDYFERTEEGIAIIQVSGVIAKYARMVGGVSQPRGTSIERLRSQMQAALEDRTIYGIVLHIESPGGVIDGLADFADELHQAITEKPVVAFADDLCASAAYWLASQCSAIFANQTADVGSIGVYTLYLDTSKAFEQAGLKFHIFRSGPHKGVGSPGIEITEDNQRVIQQKVDAKFEVFINAVLRGRIIKGLDEERLRLLADGRTFMGAEAKGQKLIDEIGGLEDAVRYAADVAAGKVQVMADESASENITYKLKGKAMDKEKTDAKETAAAERERIAQIQKALGNERFKEVCQKAIDEGWTPERAKAEALDVVLAKESEEIGRLKGELAEASKKLEVLAKSGDDTAKAAEASDQAEAGGGSGALVDDGKAETFERAVAELKEKFGSKAQAMSEAAFRYPKSHQAYKDGLPKIKE